MKESREMGWGVLWAHRGEMCRQLCRTSACGLSWGLVGPRHAPCAPIPPTATCPPKMGKRETDLAAWACRGTLPAAGPGTHLWPWYPSPLPGKEYLLSQQSHGCLSLFLSPSLCVFSLSHTSFKL